MQRLALALLARHDDALPATRLYKWLGGSPCRVDKQEINCTKQIYNLSPSSLMLVFIDGQYLERVQSLMMVALFSVAWLLAGNVSSNRE